MILNGLDTILESEFKLGTTVICLCLSLAMGLGLAFLYRFFKRRQGFSIDMPIAIIIFPLIVCGIVMVSRIIGINSATERTTLGFSFAGLLAITRFRSNQKDATDLTFITIGIITGFINGLGYVVISMIIYAFAVITILLINLTKINVPSIKEMTLKVIVPENLNYDNLFDDILDDYCGVWNMKSVKTTEFGTMFELTFVLNFKDTSKQHEFIDKIRERNGNLTVSLNVRRFNTTISQ